MSSILNVSSLTAGYGHIKVLRDLTFEVPQQGVTAIIGPNGHGKSTLLRAISGLCKTWSGTITFAGARMPVAAPERARLGLVHVPQGDQLFMNLSVEENLQMGAYARADRNQVLQSLDQVYELFPRLKERRRQVASALSGGERRMVGIGRGMMADGKLMMIDEPSLGLAPLLIEQIYAALGTLADSERAILVVEENPSRVASVASRFFLMDGGQFAWRGDASDLNASKEIVATYLGG